MDKGSGIKPALGDLRRGRRLQSKIRQEMDNDPNTKIALAGALIISSVSAALAGDHEDQHWDSLEEIPGREEIQRAHPATGLSRGGVRVRTLDSQAGLLASEGQSRLLSFRKAPSARAVLFSRALLTQRATMKPKLPSRTINLVSRIYRGMAAAVWLFVGIRMVRTLIGLAKMVPVRASDRSKLR
jgi:hypothetical protein